MSNMGNSPSVSIIIPAYNTEKYIRKCFDSVLNQTYRNFECIIVDDCAIDMTPSICDEYAARDMRFTVIHKKNNGGVWSAVNDGLKMAASPYILEVDSDDWLEDNMVEELIKTANADPDADMVICDLEADNFDDYQTLIYNSSYASKLDVKEQLRETISYKLPTGLDYRLIKRELFNYVDLTNGIPTMGGDRYVVACLLSHTKKTAYVDKHLYHYCIHSDSATHNKAKERKRRADLYKCHLMIYNYLSSQSGVNINDYEPVLTQTIQKLRYKYYTKGLSGLGEFIEIYKLSPKAHISFDTLVWISKKIVKLILPYFFYIILKFIAKSIRRAK